jgi:trimeric autotransporter adhesin
LGGISSNASGYYLCFVSGAWTVNFGASCSLSDIRLKKDLQPLPSPLEQIMKLHPVTFFWKDPHKYGKGQQVGLIAQDVEKVYPQLVDTHPDGGLKSLRYDALTAPLIGAVKELKGYFDSFRAETDKSIQQLKADNDNLRAEFEAYKRTHP